MKTHILMRAALTVGIAVTCLLSVAPAQQPCHYPPMMPVRDTGELEFLAVDIARRAVLAHYPQVGHDPMRTMEVRVRPEGDIIHTFAKVQWSYTDARGPRYHEAEVYASLVYTPDARRMYDISYKDNYLVPHRAFNRRIELVSKYNEAFERRDPLRRPAPLIGRRLSFLAPRRSRWVWHLLGGDHGWHVFSADDEIAPAYYPVEPPVPTP